MKSIIIAPTRDDEDQECFEWTVKDCHEVLAGGYCRTREEAESDARVALVAHLFGCSPEAVISQLAKNSAQLSDMAGKARSTGRKVNGYSAAELSAKADQYAAKSKV